MRKSLQTSMHSNLHICTIMLFHKNIPEYTEETVKNSIFRSQLNETLALLNYHFQQFDFYFSSLLIPELCSEFLNRMSEQIMAYKILFYHPNILRAFCISRKSKHKTEFIQSSKVGKKVNWRAIIPSGNFFGT